MSAAALRATPILFGFTRRGLGGDGPNALLRLMSLAQAERLYSGPLHSLAI